MSAGRRVDAVLLATLLACVLAFFWLGIVLGRGAQARANEKDAAVIREEMLENEARVIRAERRLRETNEICVCGHVGCLKERAAMKARVKREVEAGWSD